MFFMDVFGNSYFFDGYIVGVYDMDVSVVLKYSYCFLIKGW